MSRPHWTRFRVEFKGRDIFLYSTPGSKVSYSNFLEWRFAAEDSGYTYEEFEKLEGWRQAAHVAKYRAKNKIEAVLAEEARKEQLRRTKKNGNNRTA